MRGPHFFRARFLILALPVALFIFFPGPSEAKKAKELDLTDTVATNRILTDFSSMVQGSGLASFMSSRGPFTLFAPTNSAFSKLPPGTLDALLRPENKEVLQRILLFHLVNGQRYSAKDILKLKSLLSCEGHPLPMRVARSGAQLVIKAKILHADMRCANGVIHEIDTVLLPPGVSLSNLAPPAPPAPAATTNTDSGTAAGTNADGSPSTNGSPAASGLTPPATPAVSPD
jgi:uncharacterized surface protein with fasciclin (FAS1) repeats